MRQHRPGPRGRSGRTERRGIRGDFGPPTPSERHRVCAPPTNRSVAGPAFAKLKAAYPVLSGFGIGELWAGWIDLTPNSLPVISAVARVPGLSLATSFSGHGLGIGLGAGRLTEELVAGDAPSVDPHPFRYARLMDGSNLGAPGVM